MAYDVKLAARVHDRLSAMRGFSEREMFGGLCFLLNGHMCAGIVGHTLMLRVGPEQYSAALARPHAREMDFTGRPLKGMVYVDPPGIATGAALSRWLRLATDYVGRQAPKAKPVQSGRARRQARPRRRGRRPTRP
jgi:TfoX/Sxy family transcriptional regulator of competence genes